MGSKIRKKITVYEDNESNAKEAVSRFEKMLFSQGLRKRDDIPTPEYIEEDIGCIRKKDPFWKNADLLKYLHPENKDIRGFIHLYRSYDEDNEGECVKPYSFWTVRGYVEISKDSIHKCPVEKMEQERVTRERKRLKCL